MKLLLDTHALLWWLNDDRRLGRQARDLIADPGQDVLVSAASLWDIVVKIRIGKLLADSKEISEAIEVEGFTLLNTSRVHLTVLSGLPLYPDHRDPFDHLLIAQAIAEGATFVSTHHAAPATTSAKREGRVGRFRGSRLTRPASPSARTRPNPNHSETHPGTPPPSRRPSGSRAG